MADVEIDIISLDGLIRRHLMTNQKDLNFYILDTGTLIRKYKQLLLQPIKMTFVKSSAPVAKNTEKTELIEEYLNIAKKYYNISPPKGGTKSSPAKEIMICSNCKNTENFDNDENIVVCVNCGMEVEYAKFSTSYKDSNRANMNTRYTYDRRVHFRDCINQFQGKQNCTIQPKVYADLEEQFRQHHLLVEPPPDCSAETAKHIKFSRIQKSHVLMFLKELKYSKHYENVNLIHLNLTGIKPDDISHLEEKLMADFDQLISVYDKNFKNKINRTNFISTHFVLYQLLQRHGYPCKKEDFIMLKTDDRKNFHNDVCKEIFMELGWNFKSS